MCRTNRRRFLQHSAATAAALSLAPLVGANSAGAAEKPGSKMKLGLVTYLWGRDWDLPNLIANCEKTEVLGVELRTTHAHGVEPSLSDAERKEVKKRFDDSPVVCVGPGSNERFCHPDPAALEKAIEATKAFVKLSHDVGGSGVKVKPTDLYPNVPREKTIEQIGQSLNEVGKFAADYGQEIRLEVHGKCSDLPTMKAIMDVADHPNVGVCWNCNGQDLSGEGIE
jgi:sugar phosphate isomerase/epimerase